VENVAANINPKITPGQHEQHQQHAHISRGSNVNSESASLRHSCHDVIILLASTSAAGMSITTQL